ncbi:carboxypeptidase regulatory-like domain-containing protein [Marmoricola sp. OAE513]|uniref:carboxypeptidase regulatory-like domain-containing protein n=1 Tax=Marmoricola sp. OAE513 TaxID=2817894 RepID=UPI001AE5D42B
MPIGNYRVYAEGDVDSVDLLTYHPTTLDVAAAGSVAVTVGGTTTANIKRIKSSTISGTVTRGTGIGYVAQVNLFQDDGCAIPCYRLVDTTMSEITGGGVFTFAGLHPGTYRVGTIPEHEYQSEYYDNARSIANATDVVVAQAASRTGVQFLLDVGSELTGKVTDTQGTPLVGASIEATNAAGLSRSGSTGAGGNYTLRGLSNGGYTVTATLAGYSPASTNVTMAVPNSKTGVNIQLNKLTVVRGTVTTPSGATAPIGDVTAYKKDGNTWIPTTSSAATSSGAYTLPLEKGTYRLLARAFNASSQQIGQDTFFGGTTDVNAATDVVVDTYEGEVAGQNIQILATAPPPVTNTGVPVISGTPRIGAPLTTTAGTWNPADVTVVYQWKVAGANVGPDSPTYTPVEGDLGKTVTVTVTASKNGASAAATSQATSAVVTNVVANVVAPSLPAGAPVVGSPIAVNPGTWNPADVSFNYQWQADGANVGTDSATYTPTANDLEKSLRVQVTASRTGYVATTLVTAVSPAVVAPVVGAVTNTGLPTVTGTPRVGATLTATPGTWDPADVAVAYQWKVAGSNVGTGSSTYVPVAGDVGKTVTVTTTASKAGVSASATSEATSAVVTNVVMNTVAPSHPSGAPVVGTPITVSPGIWNPGDVTLDYQWQAGGSDVGANSPSYTPTSGDIGKTIQLQVTGSKTGYVATTVATSATLPVVAAGGTVMNTGLPAISGTPQVGVALTASGGTWNPTDVTRTFQWKVAGSNVGTNSDTYVPVVGDVGKTITVTVEASKNGSSASATSLATGPVTAAPAVVIQNTALPSISGQPKVGKVLAAARGTWSPNDLTYTYQWLRNGTAITGATRTTYAVNSADLGRRLSVRVIASRPGSTSVPKVSAATGPVARGTLVLSGTARVTGKLKVGKVLRATPRACAPMASVSYQWLRAGKAIGGARSATYKLKKADKGKKVSVRITYARVGYVIVTQTVLTSKKVRGG